MLDFLTETFRLGARNLLLHKLRSLLTALGIIFGVAAVIIMVAIGEGSRREALDQVEALGAKNIVLISQRPPDSRTASGREQRVPNYGIRRDDVARLEQLGTVERIVPMKDTKLQVIVGDTRTSARAIATTPDVFDIVNLELARGQIFTDQQYEKGEPVCVLGAAAARDLFPYADPIGATVKLGTRSRGPELLTVIGVLKATGLRADASGGGVLQRDLDQDLYFPLTLARARYGDAVVENKGGDRDREIVEIHEVWLRANAREDVEPLVGRVQYTLEQSRPNQPMDVAVKAPLDILRAAEKTNDLFNFIMVGISGLSLLVGGIGIMNIMLATVTERTREIGIRRALGAKQKHITLQFLIETTLISLSGGVIGILLGCGIAMALPEVVQYFGDARYPTQITLWSVLISFGVSGMVGIGFGLFPALKAARMNPIEALRHE